MILQFVRSRMQVLKKDEQGITLVELLAVVVILTIVAALVTIIIGNIIKNNKKDAQIANALQVLEAPKLAKATGEIDFTKKNTMIVFESTSTEPFTVETQLINIGSLIDPWSKDVYSFPEITKDLANHNYGITLHPQLTRDYRKCRMDKQPESNLLKGRKAVCP